MNATFTDDNQIAGTPNNILTDSMPNGDGKAVNIYQPLRLMEIIALKYLTSFCNNIEMFQNSITYDKLHVSITIIQLHVYRNPCTEFGSHDQCRQSDC